MLKITVLTPTSGQMHAQSHPVHGPIPHTTAARKSSPILPRPQIPASRGYSEAHAKLQPVHMLGSQGIWKGAGPHQAARPFSVCT